MKWTVRLVISRHELLIVRLKKLFDSKYCDKKNDQKPTKCEGAFIFSYRPQDYHKQRHLGDRNHQSNDKQQNQEGHHRFARLLADTAVRFRFGERNLFVGKMLMLNA